jgi:hypothetical protein
MNHLFRTELKGVVKLAVVEAGGQENCANVSARIKRAAAFSDYANPAIDDRHMPVDVALELDAFNGNGRIVGAMARALGFVLVRLPQVALSGTRLGRLTGQAMKETSDVFATLGDALDDLELSPAELVNLEIQIDEAQAKLEMLRLQARAEVLGEGA